MEGKKKKCDSLCEFFDCGQRKLINKQDSNGKSRILCAWVGDPCKGSACVYSNCIKGRLRQDETCDLLEKNIPRVTPFRPRVTRREDEVNVDMSTIAKPKIIKKIKRYEIE